LLEQGFDFIGRKEGNDIKFDILQVQKDRYSRCGT
jgi:hypothetical protein